MEQSDGSLRQRHSGDDEGQFNAMGGAVSTEGNDVLREPESKRRRVLRSEGDVDDEAIDVSGRNGEQDEPDGLTLICGEDLPNLNPHGRWYEQSFRTVDECAEEPSQKPITFFGEEQGQPTSGTSRWWHFVWD